MSKSSLYNSEPGFPEATSQIFIVIIASVEYTSALATYKRAPSTKWLIWESYNSANSTNS